MQINKQIDWSVTTDIKWISLYIHKYWYEYYILVKLYYVRHKKYPVSVSTKYNMTKNNNNNEKGGQGERKRDKSRHKQEQEAGADKSKKKKPSQKSK